MTKSKEMLTKISALRGRIERMQIAAADVPPAPPAEEPRETYVAPPPPIRLTFRAAQLLRDARAALAELKELADDSSAQCEGFVTQNLHREAAGLLDVILRNLLTVPAGAAAQLRYCEGLQTALSAVRDKMHLLQTTLADERREDQRVEWLAALLRRLTTNEAVDLSAFVEFARAVADEALRGAPLRFRSAPKGDVARFAAQHGMAVARVQAWVLRGEAPQRQRLAELLIPALVHDVGMLFVPAQLVFKTERLDDADRSVIRQHPIQGLKAMQRLYPGGGWPVEAVADHHERLDGTGYPSGKAALALGEQARLLAACDIYAALVSPRPHRPASDSRAALADTLALVEQGLLDRAQTEKLLRLTFYPAGSVVQLSDGAIALVVASPKALTNPAKATVIPLRTAAGAALSFPWPIDLAEANSLSILRALTSSERAQTLARSHPSLI